MSPKRSALARRVRGGLFWSSWIGLAASISFRSNPFAEPRLPSIGWLLLLIWFGLSPAALILVTRGKPLRPVRAPHHGAFLSVT